MFKKKHKICQTTDIVAVARMSKGRNKDCGPEDIFPEWIQTQNIHSAPSDSCGFVAAGQCMPNKSSMLQPLVIIFGFI